MNALRRHQPTWAWIAILALLAAAWLPTVSQAFAQARGAGTTWAEVCTPQGMRLVAMPADDATGETPLQAAGHLQHCALCTLAQDTPGLPPPAAQPLPLLAAAAALPRLFLHAPRTLHAWRSAQPRGPPLVS